MIAFCSHGSEIPATLPGPHGESHGMATPLLEEELPALCSRASELQGAVVGPMSTAVLGPRMSIAVLGPTLGASGSVPSAVEGVGTATAGRPKQGHGCQGGDAQGVQGLWAMITV